MTRQTGIIITLVVLALAAYGGEWYLNKRSARMAVRAVTPTPMVEPSTVAAMPVFQSGWTEAKLTYTSIEPFLPYYADPLGPEFTVKTLRKNKGQYPEGRKIDWYQGRRTDTRSAEEILNVYPYIASEEHLNVPGFDAYFISTTEMGLGIAILQNKETRMVFMGHGILELLENYVQREDIPEDTGGKKPAISGNFVTSGLYGAVHSVTGSVVISESGDSVQIRLSEDFAVSDAPDMRVWLYPAGLDDKTETVRHLEIGKLAKNSGPATYAISKSDFDMYGGTVVIWCEKFSVEIARAVLKSNN